MKITYLTRKEKIVMTTIFLIHEMGVNNISMKEIGRREGVSEASLYKHFKSKEELLLSVMEYYEKYDQHIFATADNNSYSEKENILRYFCLYAEYYSNYKEITSLISVYDILEYNTNFAQKAKRMAERKTKVIVDLIKTGQQTKELKSTMVPGNLSYILLGAFDRIVYVWRLQGYSFDLQEKVITVISDVLEPYINKEI